MNTQIDVTFDFRDDVPAGKDPDLYSSTLHEYHRTLWSKQLPSGQMFTLASGENTYLQHESSLRTIRFLQRRNHYKTPWPGFESRKYRSSRITAA